MQVVSKECTSKTKFQENQTDFIGRGDPVCDIIDIVIDSPSMQFNLSTCGRAKFRTISALYCELTGFKLSETRFLLDGNRIQDDLTLFENEIEHHSAINVFQEMSGGKGQDDKEIRQMLDECDSPTDDSEEDDGESSSDQKNTHYMWYEELKIKLKDGTLKLNKSNFQDKKLLHLLETDHLQPYEVYKLRNVYECWEQNLKWREDSKKEIETETESLGNTKVEKKEKKERAPAKPSDRETRQKRSFPEISIDPSSIDGITPIKRRKLLTTLGLSTPSPLIKYSHVNEFEMKRISVCVHLWAERKMGGVNFLQLARLEDCHFKDILEFTGPGSKWNLMKNRTLPQLRSLWRNTFGAKHFYRGHKHTGLENENQRHDPSRQYCPFNHCQAGLMSPMDVDLVVLTPNKTVVNEKTKHNSSRKLFEEIGVEVNTGNTEGYKQVVLDEHENDVFENESVENYGNLCQTEESAVMKVEDGKSVEEMEPVILDEHGIDLSESESVENDENLCQTEKSDDMKVEDGKSVEEMEPNFVCKIKDCGKVFQTFSGFDRHKSVKHPQANFDKEESKCPICNKKIIYLEQHLKAKHSHVQKPPKCDICMIEISSNMQKHRKSCTKCLYCDYQNLKKARLLNHIKNCELKFLEPGQLYDEEPLDLRSPMKLPATGSDKPQTTEAPQKVNFNDNMQIIDESSKKVIVKPSKKIKPQVEKESLEKGREKYPCDDQLTDEDYYSEIDTDDTDLFTMNRRKKKDEVELKLREIDEMENLEVEGDKLIVEKFREFLRNKRNSKEGGFSKQTEPSTINQYADVVKSDILKAFHKLVTPFDARWLIDSITPKECKFEGEERLHVKQEEPIYLTSRILQEALQRHEASGNSGNQKKKVIASFCQLMDFVELHFTLKLNACGVDLLSKVQTYHKGVKSFIKGTSQWKKNNDEEKESYEKNKLMNDYDSPNKDGEVLEKYKKYIISEERILKISKLLSYAFPDSEAPPPALMTEFGTTVMEEIVACTGCRPKVARHLNMGAVVDAKPGFNPYDVAREGKMLEEELDGDKIWRRVDPNLPPKEKSCIHQIRDRSAICSENCGNQCIPEGYNIWVSWDKTQSTKGPYYLHIPTPIKKLMDRYDLIRSNFFRERKPKFDADENWLDAVETPFFLNSVCNSFPSLDLKKLSIDLGIDVTAYSFRKIVSTWALTHKSEEIRTAEEEALQHSLHVAKERYLQNKQIQPQTLTQTYTREENLFPENFRKELEKDQSDIEMVIAQKRDERTKIRISQLSRQKEVSKKLKYENRPLGARKAILEADRKDFVNIVEGSTGSKFENLLTSLKPIQFRDFIVRLVCSSEDAGEKLRELWLKIYKGDLLHGIRDLRCQAKEDSWPLKKQNPGRKDRNSWIAHNLRRSCQAAEKFNDLQ